MDNDMTQARPPEYGGANCCAVSVLGISETEMPIGELRMRADVAELLAQVAYKVGTGLTLVPTLRVDGGNATLVAVRIQHNASCEGRGIPRPSPSDCSTIYDGVAYAANLQQAIEHHCRGVAVPDALAKHCPHHAKMLNDHMSNMKAEGLL